ncbi:hypothetical protein HerbRD11066_61640 [Herbidospora sp. RD11066]
MEAEGDLDDVADVRVVFDDEDPGLTHGELKYGAFLPLKAPYRSHRGVSCATPSPPRLWRPEEKGGKSLSYLTVATQKTVWPNGGVMNRSMKRVAGTTVRS